MANINKQPLTPEQLSKLYPTPKTYDELREERKQLDAYHESQRPKFAALQITATMAVLVAVALAIIGFIPWLIMSNPMLGTCFGIFLGMVWLGLAKFSLGGVGQIVEQLGLSARAFYTGYSICLPPIIAALYAVLGAHRFWFYAAVIFSSMVLSVVLLKRSR